MFLLEMYLALSIACAIFWIVAMFITSLRKPYNDSVYTDEDLRLSMHIAAINAEWDSLWAPHGQR